MYMYYVYIYMYVCVYIYKINTLRVPNSNFCYIFNLSHSANLIHLIYLSHLSCIIFHIRRLIQFVVP